MAWAYKAGSYANDGAGFVGSGTNSVSVTAGAAAAVGDRIIVTCISSVDAGAGTSTTLSVPTDNVNSGSYTLDHDYVAHLTSFNLYAHVAVWSKVATAAGTPTISFTSAHSFSNFGGCEVAIFSGLLTTAGYVDVHAGNDQQTAGSASPTVTTGATSAANELVFAAYFDCGDSTTLSAGSGYTLAGKHDSDGSNWQALLEYKDSGATGAQTATASSSPSAATWSMAAVVYKATAGGVTTNLSGSTTQAQSVTLPKRAGLVRALAQPQTASVTLHVPLLRSVSATQTQACSVSTVLYRRYVLNGLATQAQAVARAFSVIHTTLPVDFYTTTFPLTENPISENSVWQRGHADALDWSDHRTSPGKAWGTQTGFETGPPGYYNDSISVLRGSFGPDQEATAVVFSSVTAGSYSTELELLLRFSVSAHNAHGYEVEFSANPDPVSGQYLDFVHWNGALGDFTAVGIHFTGPQFVVRNGDVVHATIVGNVLTAYINGVQVATATDTSSSPWTSGNPGFGHFLHNFGASFDPSLYGFTQYTAHTIGTPWLLSAVQAQALTLTQHLALARVMVIGLVQTPHVTSAVQLVRATTQTQSVSLSLRKVLLVTVTTTQAQLALTHVPIPQGSSATQAQAVSLVRQFRLQRTVVQSEILGLALLAGVTYPLTRVAVQAQSLAQTYSVLVVPGPVGTSVSTQPPLIGSAIAGLLVPPSGTARPGGP